MPWETLNDEEKIECYDSYVADCIYEDGDNAKHMSYDEWCKESERIGEALI